MINSNFSYVPTTERAPGSLKSAVSEPHRDAAMIGELIMLIHKLTPVSRSSV